MAPTVTLNQTFMKVIMINNHNQVHGVFSVRQEYILLLSAILFDISLVYISNLSKEPHFHLYLLLNVKKKHSPKSKTKGLYIFLEKLFVAMLLTAYIIQFSYNLSFTHNLIKIFVSDCLSLGLYIPINIFTYGSL